MQYTIVDCNYIIEAHIKSTKTTGKKTTGLTYKAW